MVKTVRDQFSVGVEGGQFDFWASEPKLDLAGEHKLPTDH